MLLLLSSKHLKQRVGFLSPRGFVQSGNKNCQQQRALVHHFPLNLWIGFPPTSLLLPGSCCFHSWEELACCQLGCPEERTWGLGFRNGLCSRAFGWN